MAQRPIMTFAELKAQQDAQAHAMPQHDAVQSPAPAPANPVSFTQIAAQQSMPMHAVNTALSENTVLSENAAQPDTTAQPENPAQHINNSIYAINPYLDPRVEMPEPEPFDVTNLKYAEDAPADPLANAHHISGRRDDVYDRVYL